MSTGRRLGVWAPALWGLVGMAVMVYSLPLVDRGAVSSAASAAGTDGSPARSRADRPGQKDRAPFAPEGNDPPSPGRGAVAVDGGSAAAQHTGASGPKAGTTRRRAGTPGTGGTGPGEPPSSTGTDGTGGGNIGIPPADPAALLAGPAAPARPADPAPPSPSPGPAPTGSDDAPGDAVAASCTGSPPRQSFAAYAPPCVAPFSGDNGGATAPGVTASEVRVAVLNTSTGYQGLVHTTPQQVETPADRTYRVLQEWFNRNYELYDRRLQLVSLVPGRNSDDQRKAVIKAKDEFNSFGLVFQSGAASDHGPDNKLVTFSSYRYPRSVYQDPRRAPYLWTHGMDNTLTIELAAEYLCKKLKGKEAVFTDDPKLRPPLGPSQRKFGVLYFAEDDFALNGPALEEAANTECELDVVTAGYTVDEPSSMATAVTTLKDEGVTTAVFLTEFVTGGRVLSVASGQGWFPEWIVLGFGGADVNTLAASLPQEQWRHAFGVTSGEIPLKDGATDWWRAYKEIDPAGRPDAEVAKFLWPHLTQMANGVQMAGPGLTPLTFRDGLYAMGRVPARTVWATAGGFAPGDPSYVDDVAEIWWDGRSAAYRYTHGGRRAARGQVDGDTSALFNSGITEAPAG